MKNKREKIPKIEVLDWLKTNHPTLHATAEVDREWIWLSANLRGDENKATRESIKQYGFIFSRHGGHKLPSGKTGMWGHACLKPMPFKRRGKGGASRTESKAVAQAPGRIDPVEEQNETLMDAADYEALAEILA